MAPVTLIWFRRDLRLDDNSALLAALERGGPVVPVFVVDPSIENMGAAAKWRLGASLSELETSLNSLGTRLLYARGDASTCLINLVEQTGASAVFWSRGYDRISVERDTAVKTALRSQNVEAQSFPGHVLFEPWTIKTGNDGPYKVFSPYWRSVRAIDVGRPVPAPTIWPVAEQSASNLQLNDIGLGTAVARGATVLARYNDAGERAAWLRLERFLEDGLRDYAAMRDELADDGTSGLSAALSLGELSPRRVWTATLARLSEGNQGAEPFLRQIAWREFAYHLAFHWPDIDRANWRPEWDEFAWIEDPEHPDYLSWCQGRTGIELIDAGMREMYVTGRMHNRVRMVAASYLTKHLGFHWRLGLKWFEDCLTDWDPASNAMGWQWVAGSGPDAAPYFRVFNPDTQAEKFDKERVYRDKWLAEGSNKPKATALSFFDAIPKSWAMSPNDPKPQMIAPLADGRARALGAYEEFRNKMHR